MSHSYLMNYSHGSNIWNFLIILRWGTGRIDKEQPLYELNSTLTVSAEDASKTEDADKDADKEKELKKDEVEKNGKEAKAEESEVSLHIQLMPGSNTSQWPAAKTEKPDALSKI